MWNRFSNIILLFFCFCTLALATKSYGSQIAVDASILRDSVDIYLIKAEELCDSMPELSLKFSERALEIAKLLKMPERAAYAAKILGHANLNLEEYYGAQTYLNKAKVYYEGTDKDKLKASVYFLLAKANYNLGNYTESISLNLEAEKYFKTSGSLIDEANTFQQLGLGYQELGNLESALEYYNRALEIYQHLGNNDNIAAIFQNLGIVNYKFHNDSVALNYFEKSIELYKENHHLKGIGTGYCNIGLVYLRNYEAEKAFRNFEKSLSYFVKTNYKFGQMLALRNMGSALTMQGNYKTAEESIFKSLEIAKELNSFEGLLSNYSELSRFYEFRGLYSQALSFQKMYSQLQDSAISNTMSKQISELERLYVYNNSELQNAGKIFGSKLHNSKIWIASAFFIFLILATLVIISALILRRKTEKKLTEYKINLKDHIEKRNIELQQQIIERKETEESDKLKSAFLANMSHELRTPMNAIIAFSNFLREPDLTNDKKFEYLEHITNAGDSLLRLIDDIIDIAKIESKQLKIFIQPTNLNRLLMELYSVYSEIRVKNSKKPIRFTLKIDNDFNYIINTDTQRLKQVLSNLIENAFKYTDKGKIEFGFNVTENSVTFFVTDTGIGIPADKLELIFTRFYQLNHLNHREISGTGLGLAISKNLISLLGGKIWVDSIEGRGSTFSIRIPVESIKKQLNPSCFDESKSKNSVPMNKYNWHNITILVAEDEDMNYKILDSCLTRTNAHIIRAKDGASAIEICKIHKVDIVLMDIQMPGMDGYEATQEIKRLNNRTPVIAQTSFALESEKEKWLQAGCDDFVTKPLDIDTLLQKIEHFIKGKRLTIEPFLKSKYS